MRLLAVFSLLFFSLTAVSQELNCKVTVNSSQIATSERRVFEDMENSFSQFLNTRKWTNDEYLPEERIKCNINITLNTMPSIGNFEATVQVQAARPVFNTTYESILLNFADRDWVFEYVEYQPLDFNDNSYISNLTSMLAYYAYIIIGMDADSFSPDGGDFFYQIAQNIVTNAQQSGRPGWSSLESNRNRYWLVENLTNAQINIMRKAWYRYHRLGMDIYAEKPEEAQEVMLEALKDVKEVVKAYVNPIIVIAFFDAKHSELINVFSKAEPNIKREAYNLLVELNPAKRDDYSKIIRN